MFKLNTNVRDSGTGYLLDYMDNVKFSQLVEVFGNPDANVYYEPERGYDGEEYCFIHNDSGAVLTLYSRWGQFRIGGFCPELVEPFKAWLAAQLT